MTKNLFGSISYINLYSNDNQELIHFYRDLLQLPPFPEQKEEAHWYGFDMEGVSLAIEPMKNRKNYDFAFNTENPILIQFKAETPEQLEEMNQTLEASGITILRRSKKTSYGTITNFLDPDGNLLEILLENK